MRKDYNFWVYIVTNWKKTVLYVGVTNNLKQRLKEHYENKGKPETFAGRYYCYNLVYFEWHKYVLNAFAREKELKLLNRAKKEALITEFNASWRFLNKEVCGVWPPDFEGRLLDDNRDEDGSLQDDKRDGGKTA